MDIDISSILVNCQPDIEKYAENVLRNMVYDPMMKYKENDPRLNYLISAQDNAIVTGTIINNSISFSVNLQGNTENLPKEFINEVEEDLQSALDNFHTIGQTIINQYIKDYIVSDEGKQIIIKQIKDRILEQLSPSLAG